MYSWGSNCAGQLGLGRGQGGQDLLVRTPHLVQFPPGVKKIEKIGAGANVSMAVSEDGRLFTWGSDATGHVAPVQDLHDEHEELIPKETEAGQPDRIYLPREVDLSNSVPNSRIVKILGMTAGMQHCCVRVSLEDTGLAEEKDAARDGS